MEADLNVSNSDRDLRRGAAAGVTSIAREEMTRDQSALLAATLPAPLSRNPGASSASLRGRQRMILGRMDRWYEGPSLAEEEAAAPAEETRPEPEILPSEPLDVDVLDEPPEPEASGDADTVSLDGAPPADDDREAADEPVRPPILRPRNLSRSYDGDPCGTSCSRHRDVRCAHARIFRRYALAPRNEGTPAEGRARAPRRGSGRLSAAGDAIDGAGDYPAAERYLRRATELVPESAVAHTDLAVSLMYQERWADAQGSSKSRSDSLPTRPRSISFRESSIATA